MDEFNNENPYEKENENSVQDEYSQYSENEQNNGSDASGNGYMNSGDTAGDNVKQPEYTNGYDYSQQNTQDYSQNPYQSSGSGSYQNNPYTQNGAYNGNGGYNGYNNNNYSYNSAPPKSPKSGRGKKVLAVLLAVFIVAASVGIGTAIGRKTSKSGNSGDSSTPATSDSATVELDTTKSSAVAKTDLDAVKQARDSVVGIVTYNSKGALSGEGSGVVMGTNDAGNLTYIITCAHVISDSSIASCGILMSDGTVYDAKIVGYDERTDIGVLSIKQTGLKKATFGDSTALQVTEPVYAIGNPGGSEYYGSVTNGIVSALDRSISSKYTMQVIQHTAAISPGNSGGALVNAAGQVVGINSSKIAATDYEGIGFAVPIAIAKPVVDNIIAYGYVPNRPKLGISYAPVTNYQAYSMVVQIKGLPSGSLIIASISDDSSLKDSDVQVGDMITSVNGKKMKTSDILLDAVDNSKVGDKLKLGICRINSKTYEVTEFEVTVQLVEDKGSSTKTDETTSSGNLNPFDGSSSDPYSGNDDWDEFFKQFFGQ
ncbi:MAG: S1C family serine protease [Acutalibacteraceae bacterium]|nr:trypsin-like peptidase domain-containing protein [Oscillospiraceae bacterium]